MTVSDLPSDWASRFGLALSPLFEGEEANIEGSHRVLLDGGHGSFAMSVADDQIWRDSGPADWSWSSDLPHHVTVTSSEVAVLRWDSPAVEVLTRRSVEGHMEEFYTYLTADRINSNQRVVDHMLQIFKRVRSLVAAAKIDDHHSIDAFLEFLDMLASRAGRTRHSPHEPAVPAGTQILASLSQPAIHVLCEDTLARTPLGKPIRLYPELAIRHAGSEIFQEAHFELLSTSGPDLFSYVSPAESRQTTRGGAHFTPPALARSIAEQALAQVPNLTEMERLVIFDPACGSGAFLHEAVRTLRRSSFAGRLTVRGRDISQPAVSMARFVLERTKIDWAPRGGFEIQLDVGDSLVDRFPEADIILMNPPFVAWSALSTDQREKMREVLGARMKGRGDFSMAFVSRAIEALQPGGILGTILPGSLLNLQAAEDWRNDLLDQAELRFIASLGDYGLFAYALVQVAATVFQKRVPNDNSSRNMIALVTGNSTDATGDAFRNLRRRHPDSAGIIEKADWRLFESPASQLRHRATWQLISPSTETAIKRLVDVGGAATIGELFDVRQGVRTGANKIFILSDNQMKTLPSKERIWFRPAVMNEAIQDGVIDIKHYLFYPYDSSGASFREEAALAEAVPTYYRIFLKPEKALLESRSSIVRANRRDWWGLSERRAWAASREPRIVSKYFGGAGGFALDMDAEYIVVQGFAWFAKREEGMSNFEDEDSMLISSDIRDLLAAYMAVMNSSAFSRLLEIFSPHVAGGQYDLSPRFVNSIPVPNLFALRSDERVGKAIVRLSRLGHKPRSNDADWRSSVDRLTAELYGSNLIALI